MSVPSYVSSSRQLIGQLQELLLRFGIVSKVYDKTFTPHQRGVIDKRVEYVLTLQGRDSIEHFIEYISPHIVGNDKQIEQLRSYYQSIPPEIENQDTIRQLGVFLDAPELIEVWSGLAARLKGTGIAAATLLNSLSMDEARMKIGWGYNFFAMSSPLNWGIKTLNENIAALR